MRKFALPSVLLAGTLWGTMGLFVRCFTAMGFSSLQISAMRIMAAAVMLCAFASATGQLKARLKDLGWFLCLGGIGVVGLTVFYFASIRLSSMSVAAILLYTAPAIVMTFSVLVFKEKLTAKKLVALILSVAGCVLVSGFGGRVTALGIVFGVLSGVSYASYTLFGNVLLKKYNPVTVSAGAFLTASVLMLFIGDMGGIVRNISESQSPSFLVLLALVMGFVTAAAPYILYTYGLSKTTPGKAAVASSVEPLVASLLGAVFFDEIPGIAAVFGIVMIVLAVLIINNFGKSR